MSEIELVIKIPEGLKKDFETEQWTALSCMEMKNALENATPLPKGHGELIDRNKIEFLSAIHDAKFGHISWSDAAKKIKYSAPTIIEADKAESEKEVCKDCYYNDGEVHAECVTCDKAGSE